MDAPCSQNCAALARSLSCNTQLQALALLSAVRAWWARVTRYAVEKQPRTRPVVAVNAGDAFGHSRALRGATVGRCWETTAAGAAVTLRALREWSVVRAARVFGTLVVEAWRRGRGRVEQPPVEAFATRRAELRTPALGSA